MIKNFILIYLFIFSIIGCSSKITGSGNVEKTTYPLNKFEELIIEGDFEIILNQTSENSLQISIDDNLTEYITLEESEKKVEISQKEQFNSNTLPQLYINFKQLEKLYISGNNSVKSKGELIFNDLEMDVSGENEISFTSIEAEEYILDNAGKIQFSILSGKCDELELELSGEGNIDFENVNFEEVEFDAVGAGVFKCNVADKIDIDVDGEFKVYYTGDPKETLSTKGNSKIYKK